MKRVRNYHMHAFFFLAAVFLVMMSCRTEMPFVTKAEAPRGINKHEGQGVTCKQCHGVESPGDMALSDQCLQCHGTYEEVAALTRDSFPTNPHDSHYGPVQCTQCHKIHGESELFCNSCHEFRIDVP